MAQHDQVIDNGSGLAVRTDINAALAALFSSSSGPIEPTTMVAGQPWFDTAIPGQPKYWLRNESNSAWLALLAGAAAEQIVSGNDGTVDFLGFLVGGTQVARVVADPSGAGDLVTYDQTLNGFRDFVFNASGIWTKPSDLKALDVILVAAGGGSGMAVATPAGQSSAGAGGGAGGTVIAHYNDVSILPATVSYTVGAGGVAGDNGTGGVGGTGGNSTFNLLTATGGVGGQPVVAGSTFAQAQRGSGGGGFSTEPASVTVQSLFGGDGDFGWRAAHGLPAVAGRGGGGGSVFSPFRPGGFITGAGSAASPGREPGGGAVGAGNGASQGALNGAAGGAGKLYLREWF